MFKIKAGYYLELLTPEAMKLLGSTESKITKNEKGCDIVNSIYQRNSRVLYTFGPNKFYILKNI